MAKKECALSGTRARLYGYTDKLGLQQDSLELIIQVLGESSLSTAIRLGTKYLPCTPESQATSFPPCYTRGAEMATVFMLMFTLQVLDPNMDLRTVKHFIWKSGGDLTLHYRQKST